MRILKIILFISFLAFMTQCKEKLKEGEQQLGPYTLTPASQSATFEGASLVLKSPEAEAIEPGDITMQFNVENFKLGEQTPDKDVKKLANSSKGQHIHLIMNNGPYKAIYSDSTTQPLANGEHVILAFLSRSYHESLKSQSTHALRVFRTAGATANFDLNGQHLFYSRPKGSYSLSEAKGIMVDFYLVNTTLSKKGNNVELTLNGHKALLTDWQPVIVNGLTEGEHTVSLRLLNSEGQLIKGPFNTVTRTFKITE